MSHHAGAGTVTAVSGTGSGNQEQHAVGVAVYDARDGAVMIFGKRIVFFAGRSNAFVQSRDNGTPQGVGGVIRIEEAGVVGCNGQRQRSRVAGQRAEFALRETKDPRKALHVTDAVTQLPSPIVPFIFRRLGEETPAARLRFRAVLEPGNAPNRFGQNQRPTMGRVDGREEICLFVTDAIGHTTWRFGLLIQK